MQLSGARRDKVCLCEIDRGWARQTQGGDKPVPLTGDGAGDRQLIPRNRGAIETGNGDNGANMHDISGAGEHAPSALNFQYNMLNIELGNKDDNSLN